ncbi:hypothetical protein [Streptomyces sp. Agncl-13]|uniref:hypothetical protein n=1 Tax=Streptomyces sp. Agncl-13 TaxID=3400628 RepID=UPI003A887725
MSRFGGHRGRRPGRVAQAESCVGRHGTAHFDAFPPLLRGYETDKARPLWEPGTTDLDAAMLEAFLSAARTGQRAHPDGPGGLRTLKIVLAAYQSLHSDQPVALGCSGVQSA